MFLQVSESGSMQCCRNDQLRPVAGVSRFDAATEEPHEIMKLIVSALKGHTFSA
jgi:hypothetical protein